MYLAFILGISAGLIRCINYYLPDPVGAREDWRKHMLQSRLSLPLWLCRSLMATSAFYVITILMFTL
ncbi:hypothetical protein LINPERHAP1_LOCUS13853 [Linum perenne]